MAVAVTIVWAIGYLLAFFAHSDQPTTVTPVMLAVVGWLFAQELRDQIRERSGRKPPKAMRRRPPRKKTDGDENE